MRAPPDHTPNDLPAAAPELVCPAGTLSALKTAVEAGADLVYCGLRDATNARNFPGLNFTARELAEGVRYAHRRGAKVALAVNTFPPAGNMALWQRAVDTGAAAGVDALIVADMGVAAYAAERYPDRRLHLSVQAGAPSPEAIAYHIQSFGVRRVVLPRILTVGEIAKVQDAVPCELEIFVFGNHGLMAEGRCSLTKYVTGYSTNTDGVCSPAKCVQFERSSGSRLTTQVGGYTVDRFTANEHPGYPTLCKGRYRVRGATDPYYAFEEPVSLNLAQMLPELVRAGVRAFKIEGRQRSRAYVRHVVASWRQAVDTVMAGGTPDTESLLALTEGQKTTCGAAATKAWR